MSTYTVNKLVLLKEEAIKSFLCGFPKISNDITIICHSLGVVSFETISVLHFVFSPLVTVF